MKKYFFFPLFIILFLGNLNLLHAVEVYNNDGTTFNLNGRIVTGLISNMANGYPTYNEMEDDSYVSINMNGSTKINDSWNGFGAIEYEMNFVSLSGKSSSEARRLSYVGLNNANHSISFGKQYSPFYDIAKYTDLFEVNGNSVGSYSFYDFDGSDRVTSSAVYRFTYDKISLALMGSLHNAAGGMTHEKNYSHAASFQYIPIEELKLGVAYQVVDYSSFTDENSQSNKIVIGAKYENKSIVVSDTIIAIKDLLKTESFGYGSEGYFAYKFNDLGTNIFVGYNFLHYKDLNGKSENPVNYVSIGYAYHFNSKIYTYAEYKQNVTKNAPSLNNQGQLLKDSSLSMYLRYNI